MTSEPTGTKTETRVLKGIGVSPGFGIGLAHLVDRAQLKVPKYHLRTDQVEKELARLERALQASERQLEQVRSKLQSAGEEHFLILEAHQLMLRDEMLVGETRRLIENERLNADWALVKVIDSLKDVFDSINDEYFRERRADVDYVGDRILGNLMGTSRPSLSQVSSNSVIVAHDLSPADTAFLLRRPVLGFATEIGGRTSHTAIMARSLELPAVVGIDLLTENVGQGDMLIVDGTNGEVLINPTQEELRRYQKLQMSYTAKRAVLNRKRHEPAVTLDGVEFQIAGNIELSEETMTVLDYGAEGVGLFRTEYLYMNRDTLPDEEDQVTHYRSVVEQCGARGATIRTLDLGGDKFITPLKLGRGLNPVMGLRAIRFCLRERGIFKTQLRAILRASAAGSTRIMLPLINDVHEIRQTQELIAECRDELANEGYDVAEKVPLGAMIELPSAAVTADYLARYVDFFAIGTNDLIQYTLAIDRSNVHVAHMYRPLHPALLRMLRLITDAGRAAGIHVSLCGEMAGEAFYTPILVGLGINEFSMNAVSIPLIKSVVRALQQSDCKTLLDQAMTYDDTKAIERHVGDALRDMLEGRIPIEVFDPSCPIL